MSRTLSVVFVATVLLLTSAATAYAECAWVLWTRPMKSDTPLRWEPSASFHTLEDCGQKASAIFNEFNREHPKVMTELRCLPDTVDPRGPKGGGR